MDLLGSEIFKLPGVAIRDYGPGERLGGDTTERLKKLYVYVRDANAVYRRAIAAGAVSLEDPRDTPYGDRRAMVRDPFGNVWQIAHVIRST